MKTAVLVVLLALMIMSVTSRRVLLPQNPLEGKLRLSDVVNGETVTGHFSVKVEFTHFRKYRSLCNRQVNLILLKVFKTCFS